MRLRRRGWERTTATTFPTVPTDQWRGRPFIGRAAEYRVLYELWEAVQRGEPGHALVLGDSGVGKTTSLVGEAHHGRGARGCRHQPGAVLRSGARDPLLHRQQPDSGIAEPARGHGHRARVRWPSWPGRCRRCGTDFPHIPPSSDSQGEAARIRLTEAFHEMLAMVMRRSTRSSWWSTTSTWRTTSALRSCI